MGILTPGTTISPSQGALSVDAYLRIASLSIAAYDYIITLAAEHSMVVMVVTNVGFFYHGFTPKSCGHFYYAAPVLKVLQVMVSHAILGIRTYNIAQRNVSMADGNCMPASSHPLWPISTWSFYLAGMLYDGLTLSIATFYLLKVRTVEVSALLYDGLIYFVVLTAVNVMNILFYRSLNHLIQSSGASLGYAITWIMSQRVIIHSRARAEQMPLVITQMPSPSAVPPALRFNKTKREHGSDRDRTLGSQDDFVNTSDNCDIQVRVEKSIVMDTKLRGGESLERDVFVPAKSAWDRGYTV
ncbi:hypothetical protein BJV78DRAFT_679309 [Lactifluus subvellereus]|nr:hypothetical protein BJV78DRAFT_679309 [Lactifluus subvellereus]